MGADRKFFGAVTSRLMLCTRATTLDRWGWTAVSYVSVRHHRQDPAFQYLNYTNFPECFLKNHDTTAFWKKHACHLNLGRYPEIMHFKSTNENKQVSEKLRAVQTNQIMSDTDVHMKEREKHRRQSSHEYWSCHCFESGGLVRWRKVIDSWMTMAHQSINHLNERYSPYHMLPTCRTLGRLFSALGICIFFSFWTRFKWEDLLSWCW